MHIRDSSGIFGAERVILTLARNINPSKARMELLCLRRKDGRSQRLMDAAGDLGLKVFPVDVRGRFDMSALMKIRSILRAQQVDIIHTHDFKSDFYGLLASLGTSILRVVTAHGSTRDSIRKKIYLLATERGTYQFFHKIIAVSKELNGYLLSCGLQPQKVTTIQNGIDVSLIRNTAAPLEAPLPDMEGNVVFSVIGRLFPDKGHRYFLEAFKRVNQAYPQTIGLIIGDGPEEHSITGHIRRLKLEECVHNCGIRNNMGMIYDHTDCLVMPSLTEGLPYTLLEAMAKKVPIIASPVGDIPLLIKDGITGYLAEPGNVDDLEKKMLNFLNNPSMSADMASDAFRLVNERYSAVKMAKMTEELYHHIIKDRNGDHSENSTGWLRRRR